MTPGLAQKITYKDIFKMKSWGYDWVKYCFPAIGEALKGQS
jgi:hypothetical protein